MRTILTSLGWGVVFVLAVTLLPRGYAHAYLDPGSGSIIIQFLAAGILGILLSVKLFWGRITGLFRKSAPSPDDETSEASENG